MTPPKTPKRAKGKTQKMQAQKSGQTIQIKSNMRPMQMDRMQHVRNYWVLGLIVSFVILVYVITILRVE